MTILWELPAFTSLKEAWEVLKLIARQGIKVQYTSTKRNRQKRQARAVVNEFFDEFIAICNSEASDHESLGNKKTSAQWMAVKDAAIKKRTSLINAKEHIVEMDKLW